VEKLIATPFFEPMLAPIAETYRDSSLAGADMRQVVDGIEPFRAALLRPDAPYGAWDDIDDAIGRAFGREHLPALLQLRERFRETVLQSILADVRQALAADSGGGSRAYLRYYAGALSRWRSEVHDALANENFVPHPAHAASVEDVRLLNRLVGGEKWVEAYPLYLRLARLDCAAAEDRARLLTTAAEIEVYQIKSGVQPHLLLDEAKSLASDEPNVAVVRGEDAVERGDVETALRWAETALKSHPGLVNALVLLSRCAEKTKDYSSAERWCREAIRAHPGNVQGYRQLIEIAGRAPSPRFLEEIPDLINRACAVEPSATRSILLTAGYALQLQSEFDRARAYFLEVRKKFPAVVESYTAEAYLLVDQRKRGEARSVLNGAIEKFPAEPDLWRALALIAEMDSDWTAAERYYREVLARSSRPAAADRAKPAQMAWKQGRREQAEAELIRVLESSPDDQSVLQVVERIVDGLVDQKDPAGARRFCDRVRDATRNEAWWKNKIGDIDYALAGYDAAIENYRAACELAPASVPYAVDLARAFRKARAWDASRNLWELAHPSVQRDPSFCAEMALLRNDEANSLFARSAYAEAIPLYQEALERSPSDAVIWSNLADAWERDTSTPAIARIDRALTAIRKAGEIDPAEPDYCDRIRRLENLRTSIHSFGDRVINLLPVVTPIALEVAFDLIPLVEGTDGGLSEECERLFSRMRQDLLATYGVKAPGVRVRGNETDMPPGSYLIMLMEVPLVMGTVSLERRIARASAEQLKKLGVTAEPATDPYTGDEVSWAGVSDWPSVSQAGIPLWSALEYMVRHLQAVLARNLADFVGHEEAHGLLEQHGEELTRRITALPGGLSSFTWVLRALVQEQVPITALEPIASRFAELFASGVSRTAIVEQLRSLAEVRPVLPGNRMGTRFFHIGPNLSARLSEAITSDNGRTVLAMEPEDCQELLSTVRTEIGSERAALIVDEPSVRPFARCLFELEFPDLAVLTRAELLPELTSVPTTEIDVDA
jgi:tetratricopeptide (TPR) repeat protein